MEDAFSGIVDLVHDGGEPLHVQITEQIKSAVLAGRLPAETRLPPSRVLAARLGVSRNTILSAIDQLKSEGLLETKQGAGTRIASLEQADFERANPARMPGRPAHHLAPRWGTWIAGASARPAYVQKPFQPGLPDLASFPAEIWGTCLRRAARLIDPDAAGYQQFSGHPRFRRVLAAHLAEARGVRAEPEQIFVTSSARAGLNLIASALLSPGEECWIEEPGFRSAKTVFAAHGGKLVPVPVDAQGIDPSRAPKNSIPRLVYTTPSHQYPTGALMALSRRIALIDAVAAGGGYIVEDDYDSEFQYRGRPIAALQGLDQSECVLYLGTFAKSLMPALRLGFVVVPSGLVDGFNEIHGQTGLVVATVIQLALADFIERGHYRAHVRRMRTIYAQRLETFTEGIARHSAGALEAASPDGGLQTVVRALGDFAEDELWRLLGKVGIESQPLRSFHIEPERATHCGLLMSFGSWPDKDTASALARLEPLFR